MITTRKTPDPVWVAPFLEGLRAGKPAREAARLAGVTLANAGLRRRRYADFARAWAACEIAPERPARHRAAGPAPRAPRGAGRVDRFLDELAATSNVSAAARVAGLDPSAIYRLRRENPEFARRWYAALAEGYDNLEIELLGHLRAGESGEESARGKRKFDTASALRCLAAHRDSVAREKGRRALADEVTTIESINAKIDKLRLNAEAGAKAVAEARQANARRSSSSKVVGPKKSTRAKKGPGDAA